MSPSATHDKEANHSNGQPTDEKRPENWVPILESTIYNPRKLRVVCVGAGFAGIMLAYHLKNMDMESFLDLQIYEKNSDVGGVWFENRYPGVACDVPAHIYTFSFEPNPDWSSFYAKGSEIQAYIKRTATKYGLDKDVKFNSKVIDSVWDEKTKKWKIKIERDGAIVKDEADVLVNGSGILNKWKWPEIEGLSTFKGQLVHSAHWDETIDWKGKKVAVIGNGASALQLIPHVQPDASNFVNYIRTPTWITANFLFMHAKDGKNFAYTEDQKREFREDPEALLKVRKEIMHDFNQFFFSFLKDTPMQTGVRQLFTKMMHERLNNDPELIEKLVPDFPVGFRRITPSDDYLHAIQQPNARFDFDPIIRITEKGIETAKGVEEFDLIICATGFDSSFRPHWNVVGRNEVSLGEKWADEPQGYLGVCAPNMPNYFMSVGPNSPVGHGDSPAVMEWAAQYVLRWCKKIATEDIGSVMVKNQVVDDYNVYAQEFLKRTVWSGGCRSWYKKGRTDARITAMYPGSIFHFKELLENIRGEDFNISYNSMNPFRFMGNGLTTREEKMDDLAFYLK